MIIKRHLTEKKTEISEEIDVKKGGGGLSDVNYLLPIAPISD